MRENEKRHIVFSMLLTLTVCVLVGVLWMTQKVNGGAGVCSPRICFANASAQPGVPIKVLAVDYPISRRPRYVWRVNGEVTGNTGSRYTPTEKDLEKEITVTVMADGVEEQSLSVYCSRLPVLYIETEDGAGEVSKKEYQEISYALQGADEGRYDRYEGKAQLKGRGNFSWEQPKQPYKLKLDRKENLLGMGKSKHWVLIPNFQDISLMRNTLSYRLSGEMGLTAMKTRWVSLVVNGSYAGNYQLCQQVRPGEDRVPVTDLEEISRQAADAVLAEGMISADSRDALRERLEDDLSWMSTGAFEFEGQEYTMPDNVKAPPLTGGFILEIATTYDEPTKFTTHLGQPVMFHSPVNAWTNTELMDYAVEYVQAIEDAVWAEDGRSVFRGVSVHYSDLIDLDSLVKYWLVSEYFYNMDFGKRSVFLYKEIDEKAYMGPIWDMDFSSRSVSGFGYRDAWAVLQLNEDCQETMWYKALVKDEVFVERAFQLYQQYRPVLLRLAEDNGVIDEYYAYLYESAMANESLWFNGRAFTEDVEEYLKPWFRERLAWMDEQFASVETLMKSLNPD